MQPRSIDAFVDSVEASSTFDVLFDIYRQEMLREGYRNIVFARFTGPDQFEVPFGVVPAGVPSAYFKERRWEQDPILAASQLARQPFTWVEEMMRNSHAEAAHRLMQSAHKRGLRGGITFPFHGPDGRWDLVSLSMRDDRLLDASRIGVVNLKTYVMLQRYLVIEEKFLSSKAAKVPAPKSRPAGDPPPAQTQFTHPQPGEGVGIIGDLECRALALADVSRRRYRAGFLDLNRRVEDIVGREVLQGLIDRGLIEEEADDNRFCYYFKPSPIGESHLKLCPCVPDIRDDIWRRHVQIHEVPRD